MKKNYDTCRSLLALRASKTLVTLFASGCLLAGCAGSHYRSSRVPAGGQTFEQLKGTYDKIYPLYAIECAASKFDQKGQAPGGAYGHTFMYLKGACRDKSVPYPKIKVCDPGTDLTNPESGVGLALDKSFVNTRYIASDGFNFLINGDLSATAPLDTPAFEAAVQKMVASGDAKGIILNVEKTDPQMSDEEWVARKIIGSSYAVDFARNLGCITIPINQAMLEAAVQEVDTQNEPFIAGKKKFVWNPVSDQCVQFVHNVFAGMGIGNHIVTNDSIFIMAWDVLTQFVPFMRTQMPAPVDEIVYTEKASNGAKIFTIQEAFNDKTLHRNFTKFDRIPATDGVLIWTQSIHTNDNEYFNTQNKLKALDIPLLLPMTHEYERITEMPTTTELTANITAYQSKLQTLINSLEVQNLGIDSPGYCEAAAIQNQTPQDDNFKNFCESYTQYLRDSKNALQVRIAALSNS